MMPVCPYCGKISPGEGVSKKCYFCKVSYQELVDKNTTALSHNVAKIESDRRKEYEKIVQANEMYKGAKVLGFPERVSLELEYSYYIIVSIPSCFSCKNVVGISYGKPPCFFVRVKLDSSLSIPEQFLYEFSDEPDVPNFLVWLLVCMKFFYRKDWNGREWVDEKESRNYHMESFTTYSETSQISELREEIAAKMAEQIARDIDNEIIRAVKKDPENWQVQVGNVVYGSSSEKYLRGLGV